MDKTKARVRAIIETWERMMQTRWRRTQWQQRAGMQAVQRHVMGSNAVQSLTALLIYRQIDMPTARAPDEPSLVSLPPSEAY